MIGENVFITGQIQSREDLIIDGQIDGTIEMLESKLTIGKNGRVKATIRAREVVVQGHVQGNIEASEKVDLRREAHLVGDVRAARISIEDGAMVRGSVDMNKPEPPRAAPAPTPKREPAVATATAATATAAATPQQQPLAEGAKR
jgi:cytoskeletal protein CcmA (bactofilin family)